jgi:hypothetical protein
MLIIRSRILLAMGDDRREMFVEQRLFADGKLL